MIIEHRASALLHNFLRANCRTDAPFILPVNICKDVLFTFLKAGASVVFEDLDRHHLAIDLARVRRCLSREAIQGLLFHHTYGNEHTCIDELTRLRQDHPDLVLIDDRCLCPPHFDMDRAHLELFDLVLFSTGYAKVLELSQYGYGFVGRRSSYRWEALPYREGAYEELSKYYERAHRIDESLGALADGPWLDAREARISPSQYVQEIEDKLELTLQRKVELNTIYESKLPKDIQLGDQFNVWRFQIRVPGKRHLLQRIFDAGLFASGHYRCMGSKLNMGSYPVGDSLEDEVVNLFNDRYFQSDQAVRICEIIIKHLHEEGLRNGGGSEKGRS